VIVFDLRCAGRGHVFEAWFGSTGDFEDQQERGLVSCPICGSAEVAKAVMAPRISPKGNRAPATSGEGSDTLLPVPEEAKRMLAAVAALQKRMLEQSTYVGDRFAVEARAIHLGDAATRPIHGKATIREAESLADEGISVMRLPFPVAEPGQQN
jgi:hypothetical protein